MKKTITSYSDYCDALGEKIRLLRLKTGLTQVEFCETHDFPRRTLQRIETQDSEYGMLLRTVHQLAHIFDMETHDLLYVKDWYSPEMVRERKHFYKSLEKEKAKTIKTNKKSPKKRK